MVSLWSRMTADQLSSPWSGTSASGRPRRTSGLLSLDEPLLELDHVHLLFCEREERLLLMQDSVHVELHRSARIAKSPHDWHNNAHLVPHPVTFRLAPLEIFLFALEHGMNLAQDSVLLVHLHPLPVDRLLQSRLIRLSFALYVSGCCMRSDSAVE